MEQSFRDYFFLVRLLGNGKKSVLPDNKSPQETSKQYLCNHTGSGYAVPELLKDSYQCVYKNTSASFYIYTFLGCFCKCASCWCLAWLRTAGSQKKCVCPNSCKFRNLLINPDCLCFAFVSPASTILLQVSGHLMSTFSVPRSWNQVLTIYHCMPTWTAFSCE